MKNSSSISNKINEDEIFEIINKDFSKLAPSFYCMMSSWLIRSYKVFGDIDKFLILIYIVNKDLIFYKKNDLIVDYDTFYDNKALETPKINISDISKDLDIPKESVRRKVQELEEKGVIKKTGKRIFLDSSAIVIIKAQITMKEFSNLLNDFNKILIDRKVTDKVFDNEKMSKSIKENFSYCWYQFYKFLFIYTKRFKNTQIKDLETLCVGFVVLINTVENKNLKKKNFNRKIYWKEAVGIVQRGVNAMSISDITGIPRPTVVRKLKILINLKIIEINDKKLLTLDLQSITLDLITKIQSKNMASMSKLIYKIFNQIKIINSN